MSLTEKVKHYLEKIEKEDKKINAFLHINKNAINEAIEIDKKNNKGRLYGYVLGVKSNINVKGLPITCASKTLENYYGTYNATVIEKIKAEDGLIIGMTNCDEFAAGSSGETSAFGPTQNPLLPGKIPGGSSSGSAAAVSAEFCDAALGSDTGGSIRNPASYCGIVGLKPSYGLVSRYGLIDLAMSLDQIGTLTKNVDDAILLLDIIKGKDDKDTTTFASEPIKPQKIDKISIGVLKIPSVDKKIQEIINKKIEELEKHYNWQTKEIKINHIELAVQTYIPLVYAEFFSATRRFDGRRYGKKIEDACGSEVLRRILGGKEITRAELEGAYYRKSLEVKELIKEEFESAFKHVDCIALPTVPFLPWNIGETKKMTPEQVYLSDALTIPANLAEVCAVSIPAGTLNNIPIGLQITCAKNQDAKMLSIAKKVEEL
ncbi:Asp-tRNA(Asn)/Glu-tRNA(Gln) amidotransferase subunit GatA [Candidatus Pacearchaeota archaeon]|nr:Asp-tRNA(Asn)/Glu-tRNA(Gln) amidotransferase subunit GatA [Candidatus Pacearchaeota archaeon]